MYFNQIFRFARDLSVQSGVLDAQTFNSSALSPLPTSISGHRAKRQSAGREQLCQTTFQYITPQAALNSQGIG